MKFVRRDGILVQLAEVIKFLDLGEAIAELLDLHLEVFLVRIEAVVELLALGLTILLALGERGSHLLRPDLHIVESLDIYLFVHVAEVV